MRDKAVNEAVPHEFDVNAKMCRCFLERGNKNFVVYVGAFLRTACNNSQYLLYPFALTHVLSSLIHSMFCY